MVVMLSLSYYLFLTCSRVRGTVLRGTRFRSRVDFAEKGFKTLLGVGGGLKNCVIRFRKLGEIRYLSAYFVLKHSFSLPPSRSLRLE